MMSHDAIMIGSDVDSGQGINDETGFLSRGALDTVEVKND